MKKLLLLLLVFSFETKAKKTEFLCEATKTNYEGVRVFSFAKIVRCENDEVVCYLVGEVARQGVSLTNNCKFKGE